MLHRMRRCPKKIPVLCPKKNPQNTQVAHSLKCHPAQKSWELVKMVHLPPTLSHS